MANKAFKDHRIYAFYVAVHEMIDANNSKPRQWVLNDDHVVSHLKEYSLNKTFFKDSIDHYKKYIEKSGIEDVLNEIDPLSPTSYHQRKIKEAKEVIKNAKDGAYGTQSDAILDHKKKILDYFKQDEKAIVSSPIYRSTKEAVEQYMLKNNTLSA